MDSTRKRSSSAKGSTQASKPSSSLHLNSTSTTDAAKKHQPPAAIIRSPKLIWLVLLVLGCSFLLRSWLKISPSTSSSSLSTAHEIKPINDRFAGKQFVRKGKTKQKAKPKLLQRSRHTRAGLNPSDEQFFDRKELDNYFGCDELFDTPRPVITESEWHNFRDLYDDFVTKEYTNNPQTYPNGPETYKVGKPWPYSPVYGNTTPDKGRGLAASRDIAKGELIFTGTSNTIVFETGPAWRKFLLHLFYAPPPDDVYTEGFACDVRAWSWIQQWDGKFVIMVDLDASSLLNTPSTSSGETNNIQCGRLDGDGGCGVDYYATRDIKKDEEILCHYSDFTNGKWLSFGL